MDVVREKFGLAQMVMVGDRGHDHQRPDRRAEPGEDGTQRPDGYGWITALRAPAIRKLMADDGPLQLSLFDQQDLAEITSPDFPGERLIACRNPVLAADRARTRDELLAATEKLLAPIIARVQAGRLTGAGPIGIEVGKVISKYKTGKHFEVTITDTSLTVDPQAGPDRRRGRPGRVLRAAHPRPRRTSSTRPAWSPPTRTSNTSNGTSGTSNPTTWTCGPSSTGSKNASRPTC